MEPDKDLIHFAGASSAGRPTYEHLQAMATAYNEVLSRTKSLYWFWKFNLLHLFHFLASLIVSIFIENFQESGG